MPCALGTASRPRAPKGPRQVEAPGPPAYFAFTSRGSAQVPRQNGANEPVGGEPVGTQVAQNKGAASKTATLTYEIGFRAPRARPAGRVARTVSDNPFLNNRFCSPRPPRLGGKSPKIGPHGGAFFAARDANNWTIHICESLQETWAPWARFPSIPTIYPRSCLGILGKS